MMYSFPINSIANHGLIFFQETVFESLKNNSKRIVGVALIALSCLAALYLMIRCCDLDDEFIDDSLDPYEPIPDDVSPKKTTPTYFPKTSFSFSDPLYFAATHRAAFSIGILGSFKSSMLATKFHEESLDIPKDLTTLAEERKHIKAIKEGWLDDPQKELSRILDAKLFPSSIQKAVYQPTTPQINETFSVIGRALEIKNLYRHTHYVFTHGQASAISIANLLIKECMRKFTPSLHQSFKIPFRQPHTVVYSENADDFVKKYNATANSNYADNNHNAEMISVDAQFWNGDQYESALDFFSTGTNINLNRGDSELIKIFKSIFMHYLPNHTLCNLFAERALKIAQQRKKETLVGVLYAICIPKTIVKDEKQNFAYHCHPFGKKCNCFPSKNRIELLEDMQNDKLVCCTVGTLTQYRLLTSRLVEEKNVRSFAISALPKNKRKFYRDQIQELVKEVAQYSHLYDLIENLEQDPSLIDQISSLIESSPNLDQNYIQHLFDEKGNDPRKPTQESWMDGIDPILLSKVLNGQ